MGKSAKNRGFNGKNIDINGDFNGKNKGMHGKALDIFYTWRVIAGKTIDIKG